MIRPTATELVIRGTAIYLPASLVALMAAVRRPSRREAAGALLATAWNLAALLAVNSIAAPLGWWRFRTSWADVGGVPGEMLVGWALLWGALPVFAARGKPFAWVLGFGVADVLLMPLAQPVLVLGDHWLVGEGALLLLALVPGLALGRWTASGVRLKDRVVLQVLTCGGLLFYVLPAVILSLTGESWEVLFARPRWLLVLTGLSAAPVVAMSLQAVIEFAAHGGTPLPLDPPTSLVRSGPYAYVTNPMQLGGAFILIVWGLALGSTGVVLAGLLSALFSAGLAAWCEDVELSRRHGDAWRAYRSEVRAWIPRWRPLVVEPARLYVATSCDPCREVGTFLKPGASGLDVLPAECAPGPLTRVTYQRAGRSDEGIAAIARALEHRNLAWAMVGWMARLPVVVVALQVVTDAVGGGPRDIAHRPELVTPR